MADIPILFTGPMVRAVIAGDKTQTRRVLSPQPVHEQYYEWRGKVLHDSEYRHWCWKRHVGSDSWAEITGQLRPFLPYQVGDHLWVREELVANSNDQGERWITYGTDRKLPSSGLINWPWQRDRLPSFFMPRWMSRITLEVTDVRVEHVQNISEDDAIEEGVKESNEIIAIHSRPNGPSEETGIRFRVPGLHDDYEGFEEPIDAFQDLWDSLNAKRGFGWDEDPWVVAVTFNLLENPS